MENIETVVSLICTVCGLVVTCVTIAVQLYRKVKENVSEKGWAALGAAVMDMVEEAEELIGLSGAEKKQRVIAAAIDFADKNGIDFDFGKVSGEIERIIEMSKRINAT